MELYNSINSYLKHKFSEKYVKLSIDGGFTCPNRDGHLGFGGCIFCSELGSGDFAGNAVLSQRACQEIAVQIEAQKILLKSKWPTARYIAYFQNYSNTYASPDVLKARFDAAIAFEDISGLAIATRADCIDEGVIEVLKPYRALDVFWVEMGLQTVVPASRHWLKLNQSIETFDAAANALNQANIPLVVHLIAGISGESKADFLEGVRYINELKPFGVKFHMLNVLKGTALGTAYLDQPFELLDRETYIEWICDALALLSPEVTVHRVTGDGPKDLLIAPEWVKNKRAVLNGIQKRLRAEALNQGCHYATTL